MNRLLSITAVLGFVIFLPSCASVGAVIEGGKEFTTAVLTDVSSITSTAAQAATGVIETVATEVDRQTDALQTPEAKPEGK